MIKIEKVSYKTLRSLSVTDRVNAVQSPGIGNFLMSALTPTQMAELFPDYYRRSLPDVSGFIKAIPSSTSQKKQEFYEEQVQRAVSGDKTGAIFKPGKEGIMDKIKRKASEAMGIPTGRGKPLPPPTLTKSQMDAIEDLKKGNIAVDDPRVKFMSGLTNEQLVKTGIQRVKGDGGKEVFQYTAPQVSEQQAKESLSSGKKGNLARNQAEAYQAARAEGLSDSAARALVANMTGEGLHNPSAFNKDYNSRGEFVHMARGIVQWNPQRSEAIRKQFGKYPNEMSVAEQTKAAIWEMKTNSSYAPTWQTLNDPNASSEEMITKLVRNYERSAFQERDITNRIGKLSSINTTGAQPDPLTGDFTAAQIAAEQKRLQTEQETQRFGSLAEFTSAQLGPQPDVRHATPSGSTDFSSLSQQASRIGQITHPDFNIRNDGKGGMCGVGAHSFAGAMFGDAYFNKGLGGNAHSLSTGNSYFQSSGYYKNPIPPQGDLTDRAYLDSLPVGTVISAEGGGRGLGHVQIKVGPGQWASDFGQGNKVLLQSHGVAYYNQQVHLPNERGEQQLSSRGFPVTSSTAAAESASSNPTPAGAKPEATAPQAEAIQPKITKGPTGGSYRVNMSAFREAVKNDPANPYPGFLIDSASDEQIVEGFNNDERVKAAGVHIGKDGILKVKDTNHPDVKNVLEGAQKSGALKHIEEEKKKVTETKPGEVKPAEAPKAPGPAPQAATPTSTPAPQAPAPAAPTASVSAAPPTPSPEIQQSKEGKGEGSKGFDIERTMAIIRRQESGSFAGDYGADAAKKTKGKMTASGAYQFNNRTWGSVTKQYGIGQEYKRAVDAPRDIQDKLMRARVEDLYNKHGSLEKVLMTHFTGNAAGRMSAKAIAANKGLTGPQYVASIIGKHGPEYDRQRAASNKIAQVAPSVASAPATATVTPPPAMAQDPGERASQFVREQLAKAEPTNKIAGTIPPATNQPSTTVSDLQNLREEMNTKLSEIKGSNQVVSQVQPRTVTDRPNTMMSDIRDMSSVSFRNPTSERAFERSQSVAGASDHYGNGNTS